MASQMKCFSVIISLLIKHAYGVFPMKWICFTEIQIIENILCMLQMFISHINRIKSKLLIKTEKDKSNLILRDRRNVKNFVRIFVPFFSILFPILFRMIFERTLLFQSETRTSRICGFNNTVGYTVFVSLKVRKFEFFPIIRSCLEPWNTQKFTHHVSIHFKKVYSTGYIMLTYFLLEKLDLKFLTFTPR